MWAGSLNVGLVPKRKVMKFCGQYHGHHEEIFRSAKDKIEKALRRWQNRGNLEVAVVIRNYAFFIRKCRHRSRGLQCGSSLWTVGFWRVERKDAGGGLMFAAARSGGEQELNGRRRRRIGRLLRRCRFFRIRFPGSRLAVPVALSFLECPHRLLPCFYVDSTTIRGACPFRCRESRERWSHYFEPILFVHCWR